MKAWANPIGTSNWRQFSADNSTATWRPKVGDERRISTATSRIRPRAQRTNLSCANGGVWKCSPRNVPTTAENEWLSCTKVSSRPALSQSERLYTSEKNPRASPCFFGVMILTAGIAVSSTCITDPRSCCPTGLGAALLPEAAARGHLELEPCVGEKHRDLVGALNKQSTFS